MESKNKRQVSQIAHNIEMIAKNLKENFCRYKEKRVLKELYKIDIETQLAINIFKEECKNE